jgi:hypothetical protein
VEADATDADADWASLLAAVEELVLPVLRGLPEFGHGAFAEAVGFVNSLPGAAAQQWHPDIQRTPGLVNVFIPLIELTAKHGPTELALATHTDPAPAARTFSSDADAVSTPCGPVVKPLVRAGSLLLFDWRTWHRGGANNSDGDRPVAYVTFAAKGVRGPGGGVGGNSYKQGLPSLTAWAAQCGLAAYAPPAPADPPAPPDPPALADPPDPPTVLDGGGRDASAPPPPPDLSTTDDDVADRHGVQAQAQAAAAVGLAVAVLVVVAAAVALLKKRR